MSAQDDHRARITARGEQMTAAARDLADDPDALDAVEEWAASMRRCALALLDGGVPRDALMSVMLAPTIDVVAEVRDAT